MNEVKPRIAISSSFGHVLVAVRKQTQAVLADVIRERIRQAELVAAGKLAMDVSDPHWEEAGAHALKATILMEEAGEVAKEVYEIVTGPHHDRDLRLSRLRTELIQVAAVAVAWVESLETQEEVK